MISEELALDISPAEDAIGLIDEKLSTAAELFKVGLADAISVLDAVQPVEIQVTADTAPAETEIQALQAAPPVDVPVAADVTQAEANIQALHDEPPVDIEVDADTSAAKESIQSLGDTATSAEGGISTLEGGVTALGVAAGATEGSAKELLGIIGDMGEGGKVAAEGIGVLAVATGGFFEEGVKAVGAAEHFDLVVGDMSDKLKQINLDGLNTNIDDLGIKLGSTSAQMENSTSKLYQFAINAGASKDKAVEFSQQIVGLAARAEALNPQMGTLADLTDALGTKIGRGGRFAAQYQIDLSAAAISQQALIDTGKEETSQLTFIEKAMAGAELASQKYGSTIKDTVEKGSQNAVIQLHSLKATLDEALEKIGTPLVSPVFDILKQAEPDAVLIGQALGHLTLDVLPLLQAGLSAIEPVLRAVDDIFMAINPVISLVADVIDALPTPLTAAAIGLWAMQAALVALAEAVGLDVAAIGALAPEIAVISIAFAAYTAITASSASNDAELKQQTDALTTALTDENGALIITTDNLTKYIETSAQVGKDPAVLGTLTKYGITFSDFAGLVGKGKDGLAELEARLHATGQSFFDLDSGTQATIESFINLQATTQAAAGQQIETELAAGKLTQTQVDQAEATHRLDDKTIDFVGTLQTLNDETARAADPTTGMGALEKRFFDVHKEASSLAVSVPAVYNAIAGLRDLSVPTSVNLGALAYAIQNGNLSATDMAAAADILGVSVDDLKASAAETTKYIDGLSSAAASAFPSVAEEAKKMGDAFDPKVLIQHLKDQVKAIADFQTNVQALIDAGFKNDAALALQGGPQVAAALAKPVIDGNTETAAQLEYNQVLYNNAQDSLTTQIVQRWGPDLAQSLGQMGVLGTQSFTNAFGIAGPAGAALDLTAFEIKSKQMAIEGATRVLAEQAASRWSEGIHSIIGATTMTINQIATDANAAKAAADAGFAIGGQLGSGFAAGINQQKTAIDNAAIDAVNSAATASRGVARTGSPSKLFMEIGSDMGQGMALGIVSASLSVADASRVLVGAAVPGGAGANSVLRPTGGGVTIPVGDSMITHMGGDTYNITAVNPIPETAGESIRHARNNRWLSKGGR